MLLVFSFLEIPLGYLRPNLSYWRPYITHRKLERGMTLSYCERMISNITFDRFLFLLVRPQCYRQMNQGLRLDVASPGWDRFVLVLL